MKSAREKPNIAIFTLDKIVLNIAWNIHVFLIINTEVEIRKYIAQYYTFKF